MEKHETITHTTTSTEEVLSEVRCDKCGRLLKIGEAYNGPYHGKTKDNGPYIRLSWHHGDWGNDSVDSFEEFDYCMDCIGHVFSKEAMDFIKEHPRTGEVDIRAKTSYVPEDYNFETDSETTRAKAEAEAHAREENQRLSEQFRHIDPDELGFVPRPAIGSGFMPPIINIP